MNFCVPFYIEYCNYIHYTGELYEKVKEDYSSFNKIPRILFLHKHRYIILYGDNVFVYTRKLVLFVWKKNLFTNICNFYLPYLYVSLLNITNICYSSHYAVDCIVKYVQKLEM